MKNLLKYIVIKFVLFGVVVLSACESRSAQKTVSGNELAVATAAAQHVTSTLKAATGPADKSTLHLLKEDAVSYVFIVRTVNVNQLPGQEWLIIYRKRDARVEVLPGQ
ncbi:hypothetical protein [Massilia pseudoviolaceinigra]|uniref:hypothetical protein n=1 Tax=Massilia pseudoviolaceinigra TaxID=3057165 RepID=UPI002796422F|nr:hypothetical protein [Massilia sp. CCM 9206]MDQ1925146.1 hypothetical protein [Massilia sp. CCM 9206]